MWLELQVPSAMAVHVLAMYIHGREGIMFVTGDHKGREGHNLLMPRMRGLRQQPSQLRQEAGTVEVVCPIAAGNPLGYYLQSGRCLPGIASSVVERGKLQKLTSDDVTLLVLLAVDIQDTRGRMCDLRQGLRLHWTSKMHREPLQRL